MRLAGRLEAVAVCCALALFAIPTRAEAPSGELTFVVGGPEGPCGALGIPWPVDPWTEAEAVLLETWIAEYYESTKALYGNPYTSLEVQVCKVSTMPSSGAGGRGWIMLRSIRPSVFVHEMIHNFDHLEVPFRSLCSNVDGEGMDQAAMTAVASGVCATRDCDDPASPYYFSNAHHQNAVDVYYDGENVPAAGPFPAPLYEQMSVQYYLAGMAYAKVLVEHPAYFREFRRAFWEDTIENPPPEIGCRSRAEFLAMAGAIAPEVEGADFETWYGRQHVFGPFLWPVPPFQARSMRRTTGSPESTVHVYGTGPIAWTISDNEDLPLSSGSAEPDTTTGRIEVALPEGYAGAVRLIASNTGGTSSRFWPAGPPLDGVFGVVAHAGAGMVAIERAGSADPPVSVPVASGLFQAPALASTPGAFRATYTSPAGGTAERVFTKDVSRYFVLFELPDLGTTAPDAPAAIGRGEAFQAAATVTSHGDAPSPPSSLRLLLSADPVRDASDTLIGTADVPGLSPGEAILVDAAAAIPAGAEPGPRFIVACVNDPEVFAESSHADDCAAAALEVTGPVLTATVRPPVREDGSSVFKATRGAIPLKFGLFSDGAQTCALPPATITLSRIVAAGAESVPEDVYAMPADDGSLFRVSECQYVYNLNAGALGAGGYRVSIAIEGRVVGTTEFALR